MGNTVNQPGSKVADAVLLIGGAGYIGRHVAWALHDAGYKAIILDDLSTGSRAYLPPCELVIEDITTLDPAGLSRWRGHVSSVMHFAALTSAPESVDRPQAYHHVNVIGTERALALASFLGARTFVFSSTAAVYGDPVRLPVDEAHPLNPANPYGASKVSAEQAVVEQCRSGGMKGIILRYFNVAGSDPLLRTGDVREPSGNLIHRLIACIDRDDAEFQVYGTDYDTPDGTARRDFVHVSDVASAHVHAMKSAGLLDEAVAVLNVGYGHSFSVREILEAFKRLLPERFAPVISEYPRRTGDIAEIWADTAAIRQIGWRPEFDDLARILRHNIDWHLRTGKKADAEAIR